MFSMDRPAEAPTRIQSTRCLVFAWVGQPMSACEDCAQPVWHHLYHPPYGGARPLFWVRQFNWRGEWVWKRVGSVIDLREFADKGYDVIPLGRAA